MAQFSTPIWMITDEIVIAKRDIKSNLTNIVAARLPNDSVSEKIQFQEEEILVTVPDLKLSIVSSPDGTKIAYFTKILNVLERNKLSSEKLNSKYSVTEIKDALNYYFWSPNSRYLLFLTRLDGKFYWSIYDTQTQDKYNLAVAKLNEQFTGSYLAFSFQYAHSLTFFSPDSQTIVYTSVNGTKSEVFTCNVQKGSLPKKIAEGIFASWSPN